MVVPTAIGTTSHWYHPSWFGHLVVHFSQGRRHFICQCACYNHNVWLPWTCSKYNAKTIHVVPGRCCVHHLHCTTGQSKRHWPQRTTTGPIHNVVHACATQPTEHCTRWKKTRTIKNKGWPFAQKKWVLQPNRKVQKQIKKKGQASAKKGRAETNKSTGASTSWMDVAGSVS